MAHSMDTLAVALSSGLPRRQALKAVAATLLAATSGLSVAHAASRVSLKQKGTPSSRVPARTVVLQLTRAGKRSKLTVAERRVGRITLSGLATAAIVPGSVPETGEVEVSIYEADGMTLLERMLLEVGGRGHRVITPLLQGTEVAAISVRTLELLPASDSLTDDCCVHCSWGTACGSAACCDSSDPAGGYCCDSGACNPPPCDI